MEFFTIERTILMIILAIGTANSALAPMRPIFEITGEIVPLLGNPLGGGSPEIVKRNIKMHVSNQQRIFNREISERMKAQRTLMRSLKPQDSYLRAFHEQHEQFHMDLERKMMEQMAANKKEEMKQINIRNSTKTPIISNVRKDPRIVNPNQINRKELNKFDKKQYVETTENVRNKRLDVDHLENKEILVKTPRSIQYAPGHFLPMKPQVQVTSDVYGNPYYTRALIKQASSPSYYVPTEKFNAGDVSELTSTALKGSNYNNQYSQLNGYYKNNGDIESSLTALIGKQPDDQLKGLTYLLQQSSASNHKVTDADLKNAHINLKASSIDVPEDYYDKYENQSPYTTPVNSYQQYIYGHETYDYDRDHTPITEQTEDVNDSRKPPPRIVPLPTSYTYVTDNPATTTSASNYYKVEVASEIRHGGSDLGSSLYNPTPSYSYTSGHDNVSIEVKDKHKVNYNNKHNVDFDDEQEVYASADNYNKTIPFGAKLRPKNTKTLSRYKRQINYNTNDFVSLINSMNSQKITPRVSNTKSINFTNSYPTANKLKTSITNSFSLDNTTQFSNQILRHLSPHINCSECFKANGESEFYYYDDSTSNNSSESLLNDDFPSYDDLQNGNKDSKQKSKLTLKAIPADSREMKNPHTEALKIRLANKPRLYKVVNGIKMRVMSPNPGRYRKFLIRKPVKFFYNRYANDYDMYRLRGSQLNNAYYDQSEYGDDYADEYYDEEEMLLIDDDGRKNYDPYEDYASQTQYASGYNYFDDYISIDALQGRNKKYNRQRFTRGKGKNRYASNFDDNSDYINEDVFNGYTRNVRNRYRYPPLGDEYDYPQNPYLDNYDDLLNDDSYENFNKGHRFKTQESQFQNLYADKGFSDSYGNDFSSFGVDKKKKKQDPSNFYVENYNQYVTKHNPYLQSSHENDHQKPISVFNIFRNESPQKGHNFDKHKLIDDGDLIHIENVNVFPHGKNKGGWKGPKKPPRHFPYKPHRPTKHRRRKPSKWRRPRPLFHRRSSPKKKYHMLTNLSKINRKVPHH